MKEYNYFLCYTPESESVEFSGKHSFTLHPSLDPYGQNHRWKDTLILVGLATLTGSSRLILVGLATLTGSSKLILVGLATLMGSSRLILVGLAPLMGSSRLILVGLVTLTGSSRYAHFAWAGGTFFPVVLLSQFLVLAGNRFWFYILTYAT